MEDKTLVQIYLPASHTWHDVWLPNDLMMGQVFQLVGDIAEDLSSGLYRPKGDVALCDYDTGLVYKASDLVKDAGIKNGSKLMFL